MFTHADAILKTHQVTHKDDKLLQGRVCSRCSGETGGVGAAAIELVRMVDVRQDRGIILDVPGLFLVSLCWHVGSFGCGFRRFRC